MNPMNWRQTFLRHHIATQLDQRRSLDVLPVESLWRQIEDCGCVDPAIGAPVDRDHPLVRERVSVRRFFYGFQLPDEPRLYVPVRVKPVESPIHHSDETDRDFFRRHPWPGNRVRTHYNELSQLLAAMSARQTDPRSPDNRGVVLLSRSGSGKTVACWKAFYDCLFAAPGETVPALHGFVPCWLPLNPRTAEQQPELLLDHLADLVGLRYGGRTLVQHWLRVGPTLLIFCDLNRAVGKHQEFAQALLEFQQNWGKYGHRCVVAYRSTQADSGPMTTLGIDGDRYFGFYDLLPLEAGEALGYVRSLRAFQTNLEQQELPAAWKIKFPPRDADLEQQVIGQLAAEHIVRTTGVEDGPLSTPLLMHFVTEIPLKSLHPELTLPELYNGVLNQHLGREWSFFYNKLGELDPEERKKMTRSKMGRLVQLALRRVALAILDEGENGATGTRLPLDNVRAFLQSNICPNSRRVARWADQGDFFQENPVLSEELGELQVELVLDFSLFRRESIRVDGHWEETLGFLHDSFIYHLAADDLVEYTGPAERFSELNTAWSRAAAARIARRPEQWVRPMPFLAGRLAAFDRAAKAKYPASPFLVDDLLWDLLEQSDQPVWVDIVRQFCRGVRSDPLLALGEAAIVMQPGLPVRYPASLWALVLNYLRLQPSAEPRVIQFLKRGEKS